MDGITLNSLFLTPHFLSPPPGTDVAKEASDLVLLEKDLNILSFGVKVGRITHGNTIKYIKVC